MRGAFQRYITTSLCLVYAIVWTTGDALHRAYCPAHKSFAACTSSECSSGSKAVSHCCSCHNHGGNARSDAKRPDGNTPSNAPESDHGGHSAPCELCQLFSQSVTPVAIATLLASADTGELLQSEDARSPICRQILDLVCRGPPV
jgi:hypothetical protein